MIFLVVWLIKKVFHLHFWHFLSGWVVLICFVLVPVVGLNATATMTPAQKIEQQKEDKADESSRKKARSEKVSSKRVASISGK